MTSGRMKLASQFSIVGLVACVGVDPSPTSREVEVEVEVEGATAGEPSRREPEQTLVTVESAQAPGAVNVNEACAETLVKAPLVRGPVDVVVIIDNSASMGEELAAVERNINYNFARLLEEGGADYRVVLVSQHRNYRRDGFADTAICVESPLSGLDDCEAAREPVFSPRFFHYSTQVQSSDSLVLLVDTFEPPVSIRNWEEQFGNAPQGWSQWLRPGVRKVFLEVSDDDSEMVAGEFLERLTALDPVAFGSVAAPEFVFHSIVGLQPNEDGAAPYTSDEPLVEESCQSGSFEGYTAGLEYQRLSQLTGGLRFPICETGRYDAVFREIAGSALLSATLRCDFAIPEAPAGLEIDPERVGVSVRSGTGETARSLSQRAGSADCSEGDFFIFEGRIELCPSTCDALLRDPLAKVDVLFACESTLR